MRIGQGFPFARANYSHVVLILGAARDALREGD